MYYLPRKKAKYTMGVKALTNFKIKVLKMRRSSKLLSVFGTSEKETTRDLIIITYTSIHPVALLFKKNDFAVGVKICLYIQYTLATTTTNMSPGTCTRKKIQHTQDIFLTPRFTCSPVVQYLGVGPLCNIFMNGICAIYSCMASVQYFVSGIVQCSQYLCRSG